MTPLLLLEGVEKQRPHPSHSPGWRWPWYQGQKSPPLDQELSLWPPGLSSWTLPMSSWKEGGHLDVGAMWLQCLVGFGADGSVGKVISM